MRISQLAEATGVSVATIKFYLRTNLIPEGTFTHANQAQYGTRHVTMIRLVRALMPLGELPLATVRTLRAASAKPAELVAALGEETHDHPTCRYDARAQNDVANIIRHFEWDISPTNAAVLSAAEALTAARDVGVDLAHYIDVYAKAAEDIAWTDTALYATEDPDERRTAVLAGTILGNQLFAALRILAQESLIRKGE